MEQKSLAGCAEEVGERGKQGSREIIAFVHYFFLTSRPMPQEAFFSQPAGV